MVCVMVYVLVKVVVRWKTDIGDWGNDVGDGEYRIEDGGEGGGEKTGKDVRKIGCIDGKCGVWDVDLVDFKLFWCFDLWHITTSFWI